MQNSQNVSVHQRGLDSFVTIFYALSQVSVDSRFC